MPQINKFLEALSLLPGVARTRQQAARTWQDNVPVQLDFALVGGLIARRLPSYTDDQRIYMRGVLSYGLTRGPRCLRSLVLRPLLSTLFEESRRIGPAHEQAVLQDFYVASEGEMALGQAMKPAKERTPARASDHDPSQGDLTRGVNHSFLHNYQGARKPQAFHVRDSVDEPSPKTSKRRR